MGVFIVGERAKTVSGVVIRTVVQNMATSETRSRHAAAATATADSCGEGLYEKMVKIGPSIYPPVSDQTPRKMAALPREA